jgi:hypothetical protein
MSGSALARLTFAAAAVVLAGALAAPAGTQRATPMWSIALLMSRIDGAKVVIGRWSARVQSSTTLCNGEGRSRRWDGVRHWRHFTCTWTVFDRTRLVDRDVTFGVSTLTRTRFRITNAHFGAD